MFKPLLALVLCVLACSAQAADDTLLTATERSTAIQAGRNLARYVAQPVGVDLKVLPTVGSTENIKRLAREGGVRLALVQSDVYQAWIDQASAGDGEAVRLARPLRVVMPLYDEEIHFVVRADSPLRYVHQIRDARINIGPAGSGTALTAINLYRWMFGTDLPASSISALSDEDALIKLTTDRSVDVVVVVGGQPSRLFADMKSQARQYIRLLAVDPLAPEMLAANAVYSPAVIRSASYPTWLAEDVPALAVRSLLVTSDVHAPKARESLVRFAQAMCENFARLKADGHAKWREVTLGQPPLPKGWLYYAPTRRVLSDCAGADQARMAALITAAADASTNRCAQDRAQLGLCSASAP